MDDKKENIAKETQQKMRILFWIFVFMTGFIFFLSWGTLWLLIVEAIVWGAFLHCIWKGKVFWTTSFVKVISVGIGLIIMSCIFIKTTSSSTEDKPAQKNDVTVSTNKDLKDKNNVKSEEKKCDDVNSQYTAFNGVEKVIVSKKPCKVIGLLAKERERYILKTKNGKELNVIVWNNYSNNVKASGTYTIRALNVEDTLETRDESDIMIIRWVPDKNSLEKAKNEFKKVVENLEF